MIKRWLHETQGFIAGHSKRPYENGKNLTSSNWIWPGVGETMDLLRIYCTFRNLSIQKNWIVEGYWSPTYFHLRFLWESSGRRRAEDLFSAKILYWFYGPSNYDGPKKRIPEPSPSCDLLGHGRVRTRGLTLIATKGTSGIGKLVMNPTVLMRI